MSNMEQKSLWVFSSTHGSSGSVMCLQHANEHGWDVGPGREQRDCDQDLDCESCVVERRSLAALGLKELADAAALARLGRHEIKDWDLDEWFVLSNDSARIEGFALSVAEKMGWFDHNNPLMSDVDWERAADSLFAGFDVFRVVHDTRVHWFARPNFWQSLAPGLAGLPNLGHIRERFQTEFG